MEKNEHIIEYNVELSWFSAKQFFFGNKMAQRNTEMITEKLGCQVIFRSLLVWRNKLMICPSNNRNLDDFTINYISSANQWITFLC